MHECARHGLVEFHLYGDGNRGPRYRCRRCGGEAVTRRHRQMRRLLVEEAGGACCVCGYDRCMLNLHFHHVDPSKKTLEMGMGRGRSLAAFREEAKKCIVVCANCHGEIETGLTSRPPAGTRYLDSGQMA